MWKFSSRAWVRSSYFRGATVYRVVDPGGRVERAAGCSADVASPTFGLMSLMTVVSCLAFAMALLPGPAIGDTQGEVKANAGTGSGSTAEKGLVAAIVDGPPLTADQVKSANHRAYGRGMTCAECHRTTFDFVSTASMQFVNNFPQLSQEEIWNKIVAFLPGRERFVLATVRNNQPTATTVDMVLDKDEGVFYVVSEVGTEKLLEIRGNPAISAARFQGWTVAEGGPKEWKSVQIKGTAEVIPSSDPRFYPALTKYNLVRISEERALRRFDLIRVKPLQIFYFDTTLGAEQKGIYQLWKRK
jgi:Pyridoxamine 5'-phosphate oxidase